MTTNFHDPIGPGDNVNATTVNLRLGQLDNGLSAAVGAEISTWDLTDAIAITIAGGIVTATQTNHLIDTEGAAGSDDLDTISFAGVSGGTQLYIAPANGARTIIVKHGTGNIQNFEGVDITLDERWQTLSYIYDGAEDYWRQQSSPGQAATVLSELSDVDSAAQVAGHVLASSGANYAGRALIAGDIPDISATYVQLSLFDANTIVAADADNTPTARTIAEEEIVGRASGGNIEGLTATQVKTIIDMQADEVDFAPADNSDWNLVPTEVEAALDELAERMTTLEQRRVITESSVADKYGLLTIGGDSRTITLTQEYITGTLWVYRRKLFQEEGSGRDFQELVPASGTLKFEYVLNASDIIYVIYQANITSTVPPRNIVIGTAGETLDPLDIVYRFESDNKFYQTDITGALSSRIGIVTSTAQVTLDNDVEVTYLGLATGFTGLTPGGRAWASSTPGGYTQAKPNPSDGGSQLAIIDLGEAHTSTSLWFEPLPTLYTKRKTMANDEALELAHHSDTIPSSRRLSADEQGVLSEAIGTPSPGDGDGNINTTVGVNEGLAQSFTIPGAGTITVAAVRHRFKKNNLTVNLSLRIETDSAGSPSGVLANANADVTLVVSNAAYSDITTDFPGTFTLDKGTQYWFVPEPDYPTDVLDFAVTATISDGTLFAGGALYLYNGTSWSVIGADIDMVFAIIAQGGESPVVIGSTARGVRDVTVLKDSDIKTTFTNVAGESIDLLCSVEI